MKNLVHQMESAVDHYRQALLSHPIRALARSGELSRALTLEFAALQYVDSVLWVPMLALMKDRVRSPMLRQALRDNLLCEAGANDTSHITLCRQFIESIGVAPFYGDFHRQSELASHPVVIMNAAAGLSEGEIAGWILVAEALVPTLFESFRPALARIPGADLRYIDEHITVDAEEHSRWMKEGVARLSDEGADPDRILYGIHLGGRTALSVPDTLYAKHVRTRCALASVPQEDRVYASVVA